ncbi:MAG: hypothetical protein R2699_06160 [Acidimicrobiales bacterium]
MPLALIAPHQNSAAGASFSSSEATRSPVPTPSPARPLAMALPVRSISAAVNVDPITSR